MNYRVISAKDTYQLRWRVLRPHQNISEMAYPFDDHPKAFHGGALNNQNIIGIVSLYPMDMDDSESFAHWRLRGMAVLPEHQGAGIGRQLVLNCLEYAKNNGAQSIWCNARTKALDFYLRLGFKREGDEFDISGIGPHYVARYTFN